MMRCLAAAAALTTLLEGAGAASWASASGPAVVAAAAMMSFEVAAFAPSVGGAGGARGGGAAAALRPAAPTARVTTAAAIVTMSMSSTSPAAAAGGSATVSSSPSEKSSAEWELDIYSRPVLTEGGKKLWELLITDSAGSFRHVEVIPSNRVNSREVRQAVERVMDVAPVRPKVIRFFRNAMFNMLNIALGEIDVVVKPCRTTYSLYGWLDERERDVYPSMEGYDPTMAKPSIFSYRSPQRMPDNLRGEQYAFVTLPVSEFRQGNINEENIGVGKLGPIDPLIPDNAMIHGICIFSKRSAPLAQWMAGLELAYIKADLKRRELVLECGINTQFLAARVTDVQRAEAQAFESGKGLANGIHFLAVQEGPESEGVEGFWLLKEVEY